MQINHPLAEFLSCNFPVISTQAGRGPWAGPVVAAAVLANPTLGRTPLVAGVTDSKKLNEAGGEGVVVGVDLQES